MGRKFTHNNDSFVCENCKHQILPSSKGCRNHCPHCLHSKHVDINPGDRQNTCTGLMKAVSYSIHSKKGLTLHFVCIKCGAKTTNIAAHEDSVQADDYDLILSLSSKY
ncbi:MAG: RNHCP domain-containing protein [Bdellovibrionota bacterium]